MHGCMYACMHPSIHASMHPCIHASMHPCMEGGEVSRGIFSERSTGSISHTQRCRGRDRATHKALHMQLTRSALDASTFAELGHQPGGQTACRPPALGGHTICKASHLQLGAGSGPVCHLAWPRAFLSSVP